MKIYAYTLVTDSGFAPAVKDGLLSLACCKTRLRHIVQNQFASQDESIFVIGLCGAQLARKIEKNKSTRDLPYYPVYIARITGVVSTDEYFNNEEYNDRPDCQYIYKNKKWRYKKFNPHNPEKGIEIEAKEDNNDIFYTMRKGRYHHPYDYNAVLLSDDYCVFGSNQKEPLPTWFAEKISQVRKKACRSDLKPLQDVDEDSFAQYFEELKSKGTFCTKNRRSGDTIDEYFLSKEIGGNCSK